MNAIGVSLFIINFKHGNPTPLGIGRRALFLQKNKKSLIFLFSPKKSSILNMTEQKSIKSAERRRADASKRAECNDSYKGKTVS